MAKDNDDPGFRDLIAAVVTFSEGMNRLSDSVDRLTFLIEEVATRLDLPVRDEET